jgi:hypothetical protein
LPLEEDEVAATAVVSDDFVDDNADPDADDDDDTEGEAA